MAQEKTLFQIIKWKLVISGTLGAVLWVGSGMLDFPPIFQAMFVFYALLGFVVFVMLDLPPMKPVSGGKALLAISVLYISCSLVYIGISYALPQYDPAWEKGKIDKILKRKRDKFTRTKMHDLYASSQELMEKADAILVRLEQLESGEEYVIDIAAIMAKKRKPGEKLSPEEMLAYGKEVYDLYECYNCHKLAGKGATKKRGPKLDNIGNLVSAEDLRIKIWDPLIFVAEGYEEEHEEGLMPDNYDEIMDDLELDALVIYLMTLKNTKVKTPKPIFHDHSKDS